MNPRTLVAEKARELLAAVTAHGMGLGQGIRVVEAAKGIGCLVLVWDVQQRMPRLSAERKGPTQQRAECKRDILEVIQMAGRPLTFKEVVKALRDARKVHGRGTVMKALADMTAGGELLNHRDKRGYRLPDWRKKAETPSLF